MRRAVRRKARRHPFVPPPPPPFELDDRQTRVRVGRARVAAVVAAARALRPRRLGALSVALVDDRAIRRLHRDHLGLDHATDVLSFPLEGSPGGMLGEVVASAETAAREARARGHAPAQELLLYVAHGVLHLLGFDDGTPAERRRMRAAERAALRAAGLRRDLFRSGE